MSLKQWAKDNSKFLKLGDGETFSGRYMGYVMSMNKDGKEVPCFKFQDTNGNQKMLQSQNSTLCNKFDEKEGEFKKGDYVKLTRTGLEMNTKYNVEAGELIL